MAIFLFKKQFKETKSVSSIPINCKKHMSSVPKINPRHTQKEVSTVKQCGNGNY